MNIKLIVNRSIATIKVRRFGFLNNIFNKHEPDDKVNPDLRDKEKEKANKIHEKEMPIKEDKINEYFRSKVKKYDGRLN